MTIMNEQMQQAATLLRNEERTRCEVWTRVMGYHRPVSEFNAGKQSEHAGRRHFIEERCVDARCGDAPAQAAQCGVVPH